MKSKLFNTIVITILIVFFAACGGSAGKPSIPQVERTDRDVLLELIFMNKNVDFYLLSDIEKVRHIRNFLLQRLPHGWDDFYDLPYTEILELNLQHERGVLCGGSAYLFAKICNELGLDAVDINIGFIETNATHVMTIIRISHSNKTMLSLFDAYTGLEFFDANGDIADFKEMLLAEKDDNNNFNYNIFSVEGEKLSLINIERFDPTLNAISIDPLLTGKTNSIDPYTGRYCTYYEMNEWQNAMVVRFENVCENYGLRKSVFPFFLHPIGIGIENSDLFLDLNDFYVGLGIPWE